MKCSCCICRTTAELQFNFNKNPESLWFFHLKLPNISEDLPNNTLCESLNCKWIIQLILSPQEKTDSWAECGIMLWGWICFILSTQQEWGTSAGSCSTSIYCKHIQHIQNHRNEGRDVGYSAQQSCAENLEAQNGAKTNRPLQCQRSIQLVPSLSSTYLCKLFLTSVFLSFCFEAIRLFS